MLALIIIKYIRVIRVKQITAILNIIYKLGAVINIIIDPSRVEGIEIVINVFAFALSRGVPRRSGLK